jgi:2,3-bisphosphoglycerate-dependent phosphoglycerate mutase
MARIYLKDLLMHNNKFTIMIKIILALCLLSSCSQQTFYIVRHAEKADNSNDPQLSQQGIDRAVDLEKYLAAKKLDSVFTSTFKRTMLTGLTVSLPRGIPQLSIDQQNQQTLNNFIQRMKSIKTNKGILIVGHTNTVPTIVQGLSGQSIAAIAENDYDNIYIVEIKNGNVLLQQLTYGKPSP